MTSRGAFMGPDQGAKSPWEEHYTMVKPLGIGGYGCVWLAKDNHTGSPVAIKEINKAKTIAANQMQHVMQERSILASVDCPFIVKFRDTFQNAENLYIVTDYVPGGELFRVMEQLGPLNENHARFYAAEVAVALFALHCRGIAFRDLKPENILLDERGHIRLTDFGFAKLIPKDGRSYTMCGTPEYAAPEIVTDAGHNTEVDWWSFGILIFELLTGTTPFYDEDLEKMYEKIEAGRFEFPPQVSPTARDLISRLLDKDPQQRFRSAMVMAHPWFYSIDFKALTQKEVTAPIVPKLDGAFDTSKFSDALKLSGAADPVPSPEGSMPASPSFQKVASLKKVASLSKVASFRGAPVATSSSSGHHHHLSHSAVPSHSGVQSQSPSHGSQSGSRPPLAASASFKSGGPPLTMGIGIFKTASFRAPPPTHDVSPQRFAHTPEPQPRASAGPSPGHSPLAQGGVYRQGSHSMFESNSGQPQPSGRNLSSNSQTYQAAPHASTPERYQQPGPAAQHLTPAMIAQLHSGTFRSGAQNQIHAQPAYPAPLPQPMAVQGQPGPYHGTMRGPQGPRQEEDRRQSTGAPFFNY